MGEDMFEQREARVGLAGVVVAGEGGFEVLAEWVFRDPVVGDEDAVVAGMGRDEVAEVGETASEEGALPCGGFEEREAEPFGDGGADDVGGVVDPGCERGIGVGEWRDAVGDCEFDANGVGGGEGLPCVVDGEGDGIGRRAADGDACGWREEKGEKDEFAEVLAADAADGGEEEGGGGGLGIWDSRFKIWDLRLGIWDLRIGIWCWIFAIG
jgi:hypothetical protein